MNVKSKNNCYIVVILSLVVLYGCTSVPVKETEKKGNKCNTALRRNNKIKCYIASYSDCIVANRKYI